MNLDNPQPLEPCWKKRADGTEYYDSEASARNWNMIRREFRNGLRDYVMAMEGSADDANRTLSGIIPNKP